MGRSKAVKKSDAGAVKSRETSASVAVESNKRNKRAFARAQTSPASSTGTKKKGKKPEDDVEIKVEYEGDADVIEANTVYDVNMSTYEQTRLENIRRNEQFLLDLGVAEIKNTIVPAVKPKIKKSTSRDRLSTGSKDVATPALPTRRSSRVTVDKLASEVKQLQEEGKVEEAKLKQEELDSMIAKQKAGVYEVDPAAVYSHEPQTRISSEPIPFSSLDDLKKEESPDGGNSLAVQLTDCLRRAVVINRKSKASKQFLPFSTRSYSQLKVREEDVKKLTPARITAVALHPSPDHIIAAAGDKYGNVAIWDASRSAANAGVDSGNNNEVFKYNVHVSNVAKLEFRPSGLFSLSYDGTMRSFDVEQNSIVLMFEAPEDLSDLYYTDGSFLSDDSHSLLVSKSNGAISLVDTRASSNTYQWDCIIQDSKLSSVQVLPTDANLFVTASSRDGIAVHDIRKAGRSSKAKWTPLTRMTLHSKSINAAYVSPSGEYLVSVALDDTIRTWRNFTDPSISPECYLLRHNNFTGRWLSTFKPSFDPKRADTFIMGSMMQPRRLEVLNITAEPFASHLQCNMTGEYMASVNSRNCVHANLEIVLGSNSSGKVHLFR